VPQQPNILLETSFTPNDLFYDCDTSTLRTIPRVAIYHIGSCGRRLCITFLLRSSLKSFFFEILLLLFVPAVFLAVPDGLPLTHNYLHTILLSSLLSRLFVASPSTYRAHSMYAISNPNPRDRIRNTKYHAPPPSANDTDARRVAIRSHWQGSWSSETFECLRAPDLDADPPKPPYRTALAQP
jgi:hypothetical protein